MMNLPRLLGLFINPMLSAPITSKQLLLTISRYSEHKHSNSQLIITNSSANDKTRRAPIRNFKEAESGSKCREARRKIDGKRSGSCYFT